MRALSKHFPELWLTYASVHRMGCDCNELVRTKVPGQLDHLDHLPRLTRGREGHQAIA
jgi:hypothetical protein